MSRPSEVRELYRSAPEGFIAARDSLAKRLREEVYAYVARLDRVATKLGEPLGPVRGDISSDPIGQA